jgi:hypothetical protein
MDLVNHVYNALTPLKYPVAHLTRPKDLPGISYHFFNRRTSLHGDGLARREECQCQVDIWTRDGDAEAIGKKVRRAMSDAGFKRVRMHDDFERDTGLYHKIIVFYIEFEAEED